MGFWPGFLASGFEVRGYDGVEFEFLGFVDIFGREERAYGLSLDALRFLVQGAAQAAVALLSDLLIAKSLLVLGRPAICDLIENAPISLVAAVLFHLAFVEIRTEEHHLLLTEVGLSLQVNAHLFTLLECCHLAADYLF